MPVSVLVVDDSGFFRRRVKEILDADAGIEVIGMAENGEQAIAEVKKLKPDVVTMDIEMPVMDGITATRNIMQQCPTSIIMFSSLTTDGAKSTLDALEAGALDFLPKRFEDISKDREEAKQLLCQRVKSLGSKRPAAAVRSSAAAVTSRPSGQPQSASKRGSSAAVVSKAVSKNAIKLLAIGTSTGGPVALQKVLTELPATFPVPILLIQHMPASFTPAFAKRLDQQCAISVKEAEDGDVIKSGTAYLAPGGVQMMLKANGAGSILKLDDSMVNQTYKPSVDITFASVTAVFPDSTLAVVLTGMGADGCKGAIELSKRGSIIWAQDEPSSVVYGMPAAVADAGITEKIMSLDEIGKQIAQRV